MLLLSLPVSAIVVVIVSNQVAGDEVLAPALAVGVILAAMVAAAERMLQVARRRA